MSNPDTTRIFNYPEVTTPASDAKILLDSQTVGSKCIDANLFRCDLIDKTITQRGTFEASEDDADGFKKVVVDIPYTDVHVATGAVATFEGEDLPLKSLTASIVPVQSGSGDPSPSNVRPITGWTEEVITVTDDLQNPTVTHTTTIPFTDSQGNPVEVYGGSVDVVNGGEQPSTLGSVDLGTMVWKKGTSVFYTDNFLDTKLNPSGVIPNILCSHYKTTSYSNIATTPQAISIDINNGAVLCNDSSYTDATTFKQAMNGVQLVYELDTPTTFYTQPTSIKSLDGENNVSASTGDVDVEYQTVWVRPTE